MSGSIPTCGANKITTTTFSTTGFRTSLCVKYRIDPTCLVGTTGASPYGTAAKPYGTAGNNNSPFDIIVNKSIVPGYFYMDDDTKFTGTPIIQSKNPSYPEQAYKGDVIAGTTRGTVVGSSVFISGSSVPINEIELKGLDPGYTYKVSITLNYIGTTSKNNIILKAYFANNNINSFNPPVPVPAPIPIPVPVPAPVPRPVPVPVPAPRPVPVPVPVPIPVPAPRPVPAPVPYVPVPAPRPVPVPAPVPVPRPVPVPAPVPYVPIPSPVPVPYVPVPVPRPVPVPSPVPVPYVPVPEPAPVPYVPVPKPAPVPYVPAPAPYSHSLTRLQLQDLTTVRQIRWDSADRYSILDDIRRYQVGSSDPRYVGLLNTFKALTGFDYYTGYVPPSSGTNLDPSTVPLTPTMITQLRPIVENIEGYKRTGFNPDVFNLNNDAWLDLRRQFIDVTGYDYYNEFSFPRAVAIPVPVPYGPAPAPHDPLPNSATNVGIYSFNYPEWGNPLSTPSYRSFLVTWQFTGDVDNFGIEYGPNYFYPISPSERNYRINNLDSDTLYTVYVMTYKGDNVSRSVGYDAKIKACNDLRELLNFMESQGFGSNNASFNAAFSRYNSLSDTPYILLRDRPPPVLSRNDIITLNSIITTLNSYVQIGIGIGNDSYDNNITQYTRLTGTVFDRTLAPYPLRPVPATGGTRKKSKKSKTSKKSKKSKLSKKSKRVTRK